MRPEQNESPQPGSAPGSAPASAPPAARRPGPVPLHESKNRLGWSVFLVVIAGVSYVALRDPSAPEGLGQIKGWLVVAVSVLVLTALWVPRVSRALHRMRKR